MIWKALVAPRKSVTDGPGWCLRFAQSFFGAPVRYDSAWEAWQHTQYRHSPSEPLPGDVPVLLWFEHWGTYGTPPRYGNWGDVRVHVPGDAIYGAPIAGTAWGQSRVGTIGEIERGIGARYVGWSEDINGLRVAAQEDEDDMFSDQDRALLKRIADNSLASYDALFKTDATSRGSSAGVLKTLAGLERKIDAIYDANFKTDPTSRGTPGGTLVSLREVISALKEIRALIESNADTGASDDADGAS